MSSPAYGRVQVAEPLSNLACLHTHDGVTPLKTASHPPKVGVLDQSDLITQGIDTSILIPGAKRVASLGSCTGNTLIEAASQLLATVEFAAVVGRLASRFPESDPYVDVVTAEKAAIVAYHFETVLTGQPGEEYPPNDCGSSGPFIVQEAIRQDICASQRIAHSPQDVCSLLQTGSVMCGSPFFYAWEDPGADGFIDGKGRASDLETAIRSGVAGGHEYLLFEIESIAFYATGQINPYKTVILWRNHWTRSWGDNGCGRVHLSTLAMLGSHCDYRQLVR